MNILTLKFSFLLKKKTKKNPLTLYLCHLPTSDIPVFLTLFICHAVHLIHPDFAPLLPANPSDALALFC